MPAPSKVPDMARDTVPGAEPLNRMRYRREIGIQEANGEGGADGAPGFGAALSMGLVEW